MRSNILVTGGAGYIGSHVCKALSQAGFNPITYDNLSSGHTWAVQWGPLVQADILDHTKLDQTFFEFQPIAVIHLAALINARESNLYPENYHQINVTGTEVLTDVMRKYHIPHIIFSSSAAVYGNPAQTPIPETCPLSPLNVYGQTKLLAENLLSDFSSISFRFFNAAGADTGADGAIGEAHSPETHLIPLAISAALTSTPLKIYGSSIRDYVHVSDLAQAHVLALQWLLSSGHSLTLNLGTGKASTIHDVIQMIEQKTGHTIPQESAPPHPTDPKTLIADISKAKQILGWAPHHDLESIIKTALQWHLFA